MDGRSRRFAGLAALLLWATPFAARGEEGSGVTVTWKDGLRFTTADGRSEFRVGTRVQNDWGFFSSDDEFAQDFGTPQDATEFRRLYVEFDARIEEYTELRAHVDVAGGTPAVRDAYVGFRKIPALGTLRAGHQYEPMGFDEQTSDRNLTFVERALPMALVPSRNTGLLATNTAGSVLWAAMVSRDADDSGAGAGGGNYNVTARLAASPWRSEAGDRLLHLGVSVSRRNPAGDELGYSQRPENHLATRLVDTGAFAADVAIVGAAEAAAVVGRLSAQGEYVLSGADTPDGADPTFQGFYAAASWFLTGEVRPYSRSNATFGRVRPRRSLRSEGGAGAWEIAARFSRLDLSDQEIAGGELEDVTLGLNWYANPFVRVMANWIHAEVDGSGGSDALVTRFEASF